MFNFSYPLFISSLLFQLMLSVASRMSIRGGMGIKDSHIKKGTFKTTTPKTIKLTAMSSLVPSWVFEEEPLSTSPLRALIPSLSTPNAGRLAVYPYH